MLADGNGRPACAAVAAFFLGNFGAIRAPKKGCLVVNAHFLRRAESSVTSQKRCLRSSNTQFFSRTLRHLLIPNPLAIPDQIADSKAIWHIFSAKQEEQQQEKVRELVLLNGSSLKRGIRLQNENNVKLPNLHVYRVSRRISAFLSCFFFFATTIFD